MVVSLIAGVVLIGILCCTLVPDVRVETGAPIGGVGDDLGTTIGQLDAVLASYRFTVAGLPAAEIVARCCVLDRVTELVRLGLYSTKSVIYYIYLHIFYFAMQRRRHKYNNIL